LIAAALYGATHLKFHLLGFVYATCVGVVAACFFHRHRRVASLMAWHVTWNVVAIGSVILCAFFFEGDCRTQLLVEYKRQQIASGQHRFAEGWGWYDKSHFDPELVLQLSEKLYAKRGQTVTHDFVLQFSRAFRSRKKHELVYLIAVPDNATLTGCHRLASAAFLQASFEHEATQAREPVFSGARLSAFSPDDASAALLSVMVTDPERELSIDVEATAHLSTESSLQRWADEGPVEVNNRIVVPEDFVPKTKEWRRLLQEILAEINQVSAQVSLPSAVDLSSQTQHHDALSLIDRQESVFELQDR